MVGWSGFIFFHSFGIALFGALESIFIQIGKGNLNLMENDD